MRSQVLGLLLTLLHLPAAAQTCASEPTSAAQVEASIGRLEAAWTAMDSAGVQDAGGLLLEQVRCLDAPMSPELAGRVHRSLGLVAVTRGEQEAAAAAFASARVASPGVQLGGALAPSGSMVARLYDRPIPDLPALPLDRPTTGSVLVDGSLADELPAARPIVLQHLATRGQVLGTWWLPDASRLPSDPWEDPRRGTRNAMRYGGLAGLAVGALALGVAGAGAAAHADTTTPRTPEQLATYRDVSRAGTLAGVGLLLGGSTAVAVSFSGALR